MAYTPTVWAAGDVVTSAKLNKMEQGIQGASEQLLPTVSPADNGKLLGVAEGAWTKVDGGGGATVTNVVISEDSENHYLTSNVTAKTLYDAMKSGIVYAIQKENDEIVFITPIYYALHNDRYYEFNINYYEEYSVSAVSLYAISDDDYPSNQPLHSGGGGGNMT